MVLRGGRFSTTCILSQKVQCYSDSLSLRAFFFFGGGWGGGGAVVVVLFRGLAKWIPAGNPSKKLKSKTTKVERWEKEVARERSRSG